MQQPHHKFTRPRAPFVPVDISRNTQRTSLDLSQASVPFASRLVKGLGSWTAPEGTSAPVVLTINFDSGVPLVGSTLMAGVGETTPASWGSRLTGAIAVEYGIGAASQLRVIDGRQGRYQLPPCSYVRVFSWKWNETTDAGAAADRAELAVGIAPGTVNDPSEAMVTSFAASLAAAAAEDLRIFPGCRYVTAGAIDDGIDFTLQGPDNIATVTNFSRFPSFPRWDVPSFLIYGNDSFLWTDVSGAITSNVTVTQFIEF